MPNTIFRANVKSIFTEAKGEKTVTEFRIYDNESHKGKRILENEKIEEFCDS